MTQKVKLDKTLLATFSDLGKQAFIDGKKAIVHDAKAMDIMKTKAWKVGQGMPYLKAWSQAWTKEHIKSTNLELKEMGFFN